MTDVRISVEGEDLTPSWLKKLKEALQEAHDAGWDSTVPIVMQGHPYVFAGQPRMSKWTTFPKNWDSTQVEEWLLHDQ